MITGSPSAPSIPMPTSASLSHLASHFPQALRLRLGLPQSRPQNSSISSWISASGILHNDVSAVRASAAYNAACNGCISSLARWMPTFVLHAWSTANSQPLRSITDNFSGVKIPGHRFLSRRDLAILHPSPAVEAEFVRRSPLQVVPR